jgi:hypothetical protein
MARSQHQTSTKMRTVVRGMLNRFPCKRHRAQEDLLSKDCRIRTKSGKNKSDLKDFLLEPARNSTVARSFI